jgi:hypothetical protein
MITYSHNVTITELSRKPAHAHLLELSDNKARIPTTTDSGGANSTRILPKNPDGSPHPKPGKHNNEGMT